MASCYILVISFVVVYMLHAHLARTSILCVRYFYICMSLVDTINSIVCLINFGCPRSDGTFIFPAPAFLLNMFLASVYRNSIVMYILGTHTHLAQCTSLFLHTTALYTLNRNDCDLKI